MSAFSLREMPREELLALIDRVVARIRDEGGQVPIDKLRGNIGADDADLARALRAAVERKSVMINDDMTLQVTADALELAR